MFVAVVIEPTKGTVYMGTNGTLQFATKFASQPAQAFNVTTYIGGDVAFGNSRIFNGYIDEVSVFNRSLSSAEIVHLYSAGTGAGVAPQVTILTPNSVTGYPGLTTTFTASAIGSGPLSYHWYRGTTSLTNGGNVLGACTV